jgi:uncharacterized membrane protein
MVGAIFVAKSVQDFMKPLLWLLTLVYPLLVYLGFRSGYRLGVFVLVSFIVASKVWELSTARLSWCGGLVLALATGGSVLGFSLMLEQAPLFLPVCTNLVLAFVFAVSLTYPPTVIERFARRRQPDLPMRGVQYCRRVCWVWVLFFLFNAAISFDSIFRSFEWWSVYNGVISYGLVGLLFAAEYLFRRRLLKDLYAHTAVSAAALLASLMVCGATAFGDGVTREQLSARLRVPTPFRAQFSEQRKVAVLSAPLESRGEIRCIPGVGIVWRTERPIQVTDIITPTRIVRRSQRGDPVTTHDRAGIAQALLALMGGDVARAEERFSIAALGSTDHWKVVLTPRDRLVAEVITAIAVSGSDRPQQLEVVHASGDTVVTTFGELVPLKADEIVQTREFVSGLPMQAEKTDRQGGGATQQDAG